MKTKIFFLSIMLASGLLTMHCAADTGNSNVPSPKRPCYSASMCTGGPNSGYGYSNNAPNNLSGNTAQSFNGSVSNSANGSGTKSPTPTQNTQPTSTQQFVGTVKTVNRVELPNQIQIQLLLTTNQGDLLVILGPANFVEQSKAHFQAGDKVTITGYPISANGQKVVLAAQVQKNGFVLKLLNENRQPLWPNSSYAGAQNNPSQGFSSGGYPSEFPSSNSNIQYGTH